MSHPFPVKESIAGIFLAVCLRPSRGQKLLIASRSQLLDHAERKVQQRSQEKNEGLECNVREELVPGICPKLVATGLGLR